MRIKSEVSRNSKWFWVFLLTVPRRFLCCSSSLFVRQSFHLWRLFYPYSLLISPILWCLGRVARCYCGISWVYSHIFFKLVSTVKLGTYSPRFLRGYFFVRVSVFFKWCLLWYYLFVISFSLVPREGSSSLLWHVLRVCSYTFAI